MVNDGTNSKQGGNGSNLLNYLLNNYQIKQSRALYANKMNTTINNSHRVFMVTGDMNRQIFSNLKDVPAAIADMDNKDSVKIFEFWNNKPVRVSPKKLAEYLSANQIPAKSMRTLSVDCLEWFDKVNGNSYFAARVYINLGESDEAQISIPYEYGYGEQYRQSALKVLTDAGYIHPSNTCTNLYTYCKARNIPFSGTKQENCKKSELKAIGQ